MRKVDFQDLAHFTDKQNDALLAVLERDFVLYGGAAGGGKSYWLRWTMVYLLLMWAAEGHKGVRVGIFSADYPTLKDRQLSKVHAEFPEWLGSFNGQDSEFTLAPQYGSGVNAFRNLDRIEKYKSSEFAAVGIEELTENDVGNFHLLRTRMRWPGITHPKFFGATNPGGIGHEWVKKLWVDRVFPKEEQQPAQFAFIPAVAADNPHLAQSYYNSLASLPEQMRKAYLEGRWDLFEGQFFSEWNPNVHVIDPMVIPQHWKRYRSIDHGGGGAPACCLWWAIDEDKNVYAYREYYAIKLTAGEHASEIAKLSQTEAYIATYADPSMWIRGSVDGRSIADLYAGVGVSCIPAHNDRVNGWQVVHEFLQPLPDRPFVRFFRTCYNTIRTFPVQVHDDRNPMDLDTDGEDHACFVAGTPVQTLIGKQPIQDITPGEFVLTQNGFRPVLDSGMTGLRATVRVDLSSGESFQCTPDHPIFLRDGTRCPAGQLRPGVEVLDMRAVGLMQYGIWMWKSLVQPSNVSMGKRTTSVGGTSNGMADDSIEQYGSSIMVRFQRVCTFIIGIITERITTLQSLYLSRRLAIFPTTAVPQKLVHGVDETSFSMPFPQPERGTLLQQAVGGIVRMEGKYGLTVPTQRKLAKSVVGRFGRAIRAMLAFAISTVKWRSSGSVTRVTQVEYRGIEPVYNLRVDGIHQYIVHGTLVANCDSVRYFLISRASASRKPVHPPPAGSYLATLQEHDRGKATGISYT